MKSLAVNLCVEGRLAVVVGSGKVAFRKAQALAEAGARLRVVGKRFATEFDSLSDLEAIRGAYKRNHLDGAVVVIAATDSQATNARVARDARAQGALVNVVDKSALSDFIFPAVTKRGDVQVAVSTGGASPTLAKRLKDEIAASLDDSYADLARVLGAVRPRAMREIGSAARRREYFETLADDAFLETIKSEGHAKALRAAEKLLARFARATRATKGAGR